MKTELRPAWLRRGLLPRRRETAEEPRPQEEDGGGGGTRGGLSLAWVWWEVRKSQPTAPVCTETSEAGRPHERGRGVRGGGEGVKLSGSGWRACWRELGWWVWRSDSLRPQNVDVSETRPPSWARLPRCLGVGPSRQVAGTSGWVAGVHVGPVPARAAIDLGAGPGRSGETGARRGWWAGGLSLDGGLGGGDTWAGELEAQVVRAGSWGWGSHTRRCCTFGNEGSW